MREPFKEQAGRMLLAGALAYCGFLTLCLILSVLFKADLSQSARDFILITLTWITSKAGTVIDYLYGSSTGSDNTRGFLMHAANQPAMTAQVEEDCREREQAGPPTIKG